MTQSQAITQTLKSAARRNPSIPRLPPGYSALTINEPPFARAALQTPARHWRIAYGHPRPRPLTLAYLKHLRLVRLAKRELRTRLQEHP